jgi:N-methylhydantoinase A
VTKWSVGTDTGGTFTDLLALSDNGRTVVCKTPSTPPNFEVGVLNALKQLNIEPGDVSLFYHGTTVGTNALLTRTGAMTALLTTKGFRDVLEVRDGMREEFYDITWNGPEPLIPRVNRLEVTERVAYDGSVMTPVSEGEVRQIAKLMKKRGIGAVAVCFLHAYANGRHEEQVRTILREEMPDAYISISSEVMPEPPEFERTTTTAANAYVGPVLAKYLTELSTAVRDHGLECAVLIMHSAGGTMTPESAIRFPVRTALSGPAGGVLAAEAIARATGRSNVVSLDVGGTSADVATIEDGKPRLTDQQLPEWGLPLRLPSIDVVAIGAGGGSIAWIDGAGVPHTGPQSAGAQPGPACYGKGGVEPTTTDANLVLGRLRPDKFLGGTILLHRELAERAIRERFAQPLGLDLYEAAEGIIRIANENMANAIRKQTIHRGLDPREFSLMAFGGAGPLFGVAIARELQMREVIIPVSPGATSAMGLLFADARHDLVRTYICPVSEFDFDRANSLYGEMEKAGRALLEEEGFNADSIEVTRILDLRYIAQVRTLPINIIDTALSRSTLASAVDQFHRDYEREYRYAIAGFPVESRSLRVVAVGRTRKPRLETDTRRGPASDALVHEAPVYFSESGGAVATRYYDRIRLFPGAVLEGPAIVEQFDSTTVLPPGCRLEMDAMRNLIISY